MRSTAFTSAALLLAGSALAEGPAPGCWARDYDAAHLAAHPDQVVAAMRLEVLGVNDAGETEARLDVTLAGGARLSQRLACPGPEECGVECDGGVATISREGGALLLTTDRLMVGGEACGGSVDLAEAPGGATTYRLFPCEGG